MLKTEALHVHRNTSSTALLKRKTRSQTLTKDGMRSKEAVRLGLVDPEPSSEVAI